MALHTRRPTGLPSWPVLLLTGPQKTGKTYAAAAASASDLINRTLWVGLGEADPDLYGAIPGARFEIVPHDGTYRSALTTLTQASAEPAGEDGRPNLLVLDSGTQGWELLKQMGQDEANARALAKAERQRRSVNPDDDFTITGDLWQIAAQRWGWLFGVLRDHDGPSIITARMDVVAVMDDKGQPTKEKTTSIKAHKSLPADVDAIVEMPRYGQAFVTGTRSLLLPPNAREAFPDFTVDALWRKLGLASGPVGQRSHTGATPNVSTPYRDLVNEVAVLADRAGVERAALAQEWAAAHDGQPIGQTTDLGGLELLRDDLQARINAPKETTP